MQIYQEQPIKGSFQDAFSTGLQQLAHLKLGQIAQRHQQKQMIPGLQALGIPQDTAEQLAKLPPELQSVVVKNYLQGAENAGLMQALGGVTGQQMQGQQVPLESMQSIMPNQGQANLEAALSSLGSAPGLLQQPMQQQIQQQLQGSTNFSDILKNPRLKPEHRLKIEQMKLQKEAMGKKETAGQFKETKAFREKTIENAKSARERLHDLERMEELEQTGKLDTPGYLEFLKRSGLDVSALKNPESQEFEKLSAGFMRDAKNYFGARVSNYEMEQFLKAIPSLSQSPEGRKRVIANLKRLSRAGVEHANAMKQIMAKNKGTPPYDLMEQVDDLVEKKMDTFAKQFKEDLSKPVPEGQNRIITGLQSVLGSAAGIPGALIGKVGNIGSALLG